MDFTVRIRNTNLSSNAHWSVALARFQFFEAAQKSNCLLTYSEFNILLDLRKMELTPYCGTECILSGMDKSTKQPMTISRLAKASGVGVETVRFYQRKGILETPESMSGYRTYTELDVRTIKFVKRVQQLGFTLQEAQQLIELASCCESTRPILADTCDKKIDQIERKINDLKQMLNLLRKFQQSCGDVTSKGPGCRLLDCFENNWECCETD